MGTIGVLFLNSRIDIVQHSAFDFSLGMEKLPVFMIRDLPLPRTYNPQCVQVVCRMKCLECEEIQQIICIWLCCVL